MPRASTELTGAVLHLLAPYALYLKNARKRPGRQNSGYLKQTLFQRECLDLHLLSFPKGSRVPTHRDPIEGRAHFRLNFVLQHAEEGGKFICVDPLLLLSRRIAFFRSDTSPHSVTTITKGERKVLSFGFAPKRRRHD